MEIKSAKKEENFLRTPIDLVFDDEPFDVFNSNNFTPTTIAPTPANALELWENGIDCSGSVAIAVLAILIKNPEWLVNIKNTTGLQDALNCVTPSDPNYPQYLQMLGILADRNGCTDEALSLLRKSYDLQTKRLDLNHPEIIQITESLVKILEKTGNFEEAKKLMSTLVFERLIRQQLSNIDLRKKALQYFLEGEYEVAIKIYMYLVKKKFDLASTHCHLARVYLMKDCENDVDYHIKEAWLYRNGSNPYVLPRIFFLRLVFRMLEGEEYYMDHLKKIQQTLSESRRPFEEWTMHPVVEKLSPRLTSEQIILLTVLIEAFGSKYKYKKLKKTSFWQKAISGDDLKGTNFKGVGFKGHNIKDFFNKFLSNLYDILNV